ncbi:hypothetical protein [Nonomuraea dietziae]|uniref:Uncharacterized protein n=1 Tax=Nonomuraea dietziae TaxID=65515 RepID=A0A7W5V1S1_9ACTN|nr:hypothetical protein [Nonomuraea dietziae]MBB3726050.1 hypothetical protein [Nonomuraea dietziae]
MHLHETVEPRQLQHCFAGLTLAGGVTIDGPVRARIFTCSRSSSATSASPACSSPAASVSSTT